MDRYGGQVPGNAFAHNNLGCELEGCRAEVRRPLPISRRPCAEPDDAEVHNNLGNALEKTPGRFEDAIAQFEAALRLKPEFAEAHYNLGCA